MPLADGPAMYFGGTIMTFALPLGAFIVIAISLFFLFRAQHSGPKLKYWANAPFNSVGTREPGPVPAPPLAEIYDNFTNMNPLCNRRPGFVQLPGGRL